VVSIVGTDEVDLNRNHISWVSPLGRALMKSAAGDRVVLQAPGGTAYLTVAKSTGTNRPAEEAPLLFLFQRCFFR
jgi:transcription elongation factor GreB